MKKLTLQLLFLISFLPVKTMDEEALIKDIAGSLKRSLIQITSNNSDIITSFTEKNQKYSRFLTDISDVQIGEISNFNNELFAFANKFKEPFDRNHGKEMKRIVSTHQNAVNTLNKKNQQKMMMFIGNVNAMYEICKDE